MNSLTVTIILALTAASQAAASDYPEPPQIFDALSNTKYVKHSGKSRSGTINIDFQAADGSDDYIKLGRVDLVGDSKTRGYDYGKMLAHEIVKFVDHDLNKFYVETVMSVEFDTSGLPQPLQKILNAAKVVGAHKAPALFNEAFAWVYENEKQYFPQYLIDEMEGMGQGVCDTLGGECSAEDMTSKIMNVNMLPELIKMACTAYGAWGKANSVSNNGTLTQVRALDFGTGPWGNNTVIVTHRNPAEDMRPFVTVSFPGLVGVITGIARDGVGISEKVWMISDSDTWSNLQPGKYDGIPDVFALREILQNTKNRGEAEMYVNSIRRTWGMWVGVGDFESQELDLIAYRREDAIPYTDVTTPSMTSQPYLESVAYVDRHPQPSSDTVLPDTLSSFYGNITIQNSRQIVQAHKTGDVHIAAYDYGNNQMLVSIGKINENGEYGPVGSEDMSVWKAYNRPYLQFDLENLWNGL